MAPIKPVSSIFITTLKVRQVTETISYPNYSDLKSRFIIYKLLIFV